MILQQQQLYKIKAPTMKTNCTAHSVVSVYIYRRNSKELNNTISHNGRAKTQSTARKHDARQTQKNNDGEKRGHRAY